MITISHAFTRISPAFHDNHFSVTGVPMTNRNTITLSEALNDKSSLYGDEAFTPRPNGSSYTIVVRGLASQKIYSDIDALKTYIASKLNSCLSNLEGRSR